MSTFQYPQESKGRTLTRKCKTDGQITLLDLPVEIVFDIIAWLRSGKHGCRKSRPHSIIQSFKSLRLTSRSLAGFLAPVLLDAVDISCSATAQDFLTWCRACAAQNREPPVRRLAIRNVGHPSLDNNNLQLIPYEIFEDILSVISPSLHQLKIAFDDCFEFSDKTAHSFRRANKLWALHLHINSQPLDSGISSPDSIFNDTGNMQLHNPCSFLASLKALPNLRELNLNSCLDYCTPFDTNGQFTSLPRVQHLCIRINSHSTSLPSEPHNFLLELCRALSDNLLILEITGSRYDSSKLLPALAVTRHRLEALYLCEASVVQTLREWRFPRLRTFLLDDSRYLAREEFISPFFDQIMTLALRRWDGTDVPLDIPVQTLPSLKRVILTHTTQHSHDTISLHNACRDTGIDLFASAKSVNLQEIWAVDKLEARIQEISSTQRGHL
ncbi:hypothetical protein VP01_311g8 [Puccinia sorghi]|uniref:F-box domain-containing protein n=1 Tax=Puccinia sorghi TaxID=27349 RepID=A0A0L6UZA5_9BASI|nr:hypothetical protein VP01_311g8 [Puccinia sorghi]